MDRLRDRILSFPYRLAGMSDRIFISLLGLIIAGLPSVDQEEGEVSTLSCVTFMGDQVCAYRANYGRGDHSLWLHEIKRLRPCR